MSSLLHNMSYTDEHDQQQTGLPFPAWQIDGTVYDYKPSTEKWILMFKDFARKYFLRAFIAACIYCVMVVIFLYHNHFQSIWYLFLGNGLYLLAVATIVFLSNKAQKFSESPVTSAISGHILSLTGAAFSVVLSLILYGLFYLGIDGNKGEALQHAPAEMSQNAPNNGIVFVLIVVAALGNTITGFFAAIVTSFTSFTASKKELGQNKS